MLNILVDFVKAILLDELGKNQTATEIVLILLGQNYVHFKNYFGNHIFSDKSMKIPYYCECYGNKVRIKLILNWYYK